MKISIKQKLIVCILFLFSCFLCVCFDPTYEFDAQKHPEFAKFIETYRCKRNITITKTDREVYGPFYDKGFQIDRIQNAQRIQAIINQHDLFHLAVAEKCLLEKPFLRGGGTKLTVASLPIRTDGQAKLSVTKLNFEELQQMVKFVEETGFSDYGLGHSSNFGYNQEGKITFFDTENNTFGYRSKKDAVLGLSKWILDNKVDLDNDAQEWWRNKLSYTLSQKNDKSCLSPMLRGVYDDPRINFNQAYTQWEEAVRIQNKKYFGEE